MSTSERTPTHGPGIDAADAWAVALLEAIGEGVCLATESGGVIWANALYSQLPEGVREQLRDLCGSVPAGSGEARTEIASPDGSRFFEAVLSRAGEGRSTLAVVVRDVTERRRVSQRIEAIDRAGGTLMQLDADLVRTMNSMERLRLLEERITRVSRELLHFDHFAIRLLGEASGKLELVISCGLPPEFDSFDIYPLPEGNGTSGWVAATGRSYICTDAAEDDLFLPGLAGARSSLTVPLKLNDRVIGILNVESQQPAAFGEEERRLAEIFARYVAMALHTLDLLVVERSATNRSVSGRVEGELAEPLTDIAREVELLRAGADPEIARHADRIRGDVEAIRHRLREVAQGPATLLGVERALADQARDPLLEGKRVLVADDEPRILRIIGDVLGHRGCEVTLAETGLHAVERLDEAAAGARPMFDLVISDIKMPDRNGFEVFTAARRARAGVPVILMTGFGYDPHHSIVRASQEGLQTVLFKPFQIEKLLEEARKALRPAAAGT